MGFFNNFNKALNGELGGYLYSVEGIEVACPHCGKDRFDMRSALLNTTGMTFLNLDWADKNANVLICANCGNIQWFLSDPKRREE